MHAVSPLLLPSSPCPLFNVVDFVCRSGGPPKCPGIHILCGAVCDGGVRSAFGRCPGCPHTEASGSATTRGASCLIQCWHTLLDCLRCQRGIIVHTQPASHVYGAYSSLGGQCCSSVSSIVPGSMADHCLLMMHRLRRHQRVSPRLALHHPFQPTKQRRLSWMREAFTATVASLLTSSASVPCSQQTLLVCPFFFFA